MTKMKQLNRNIYFGEALAVAILLCLVTVYGTSFGRHASFLQKSLSSLLVGSTIYLIDRLILYPYFRNPLIYSFLTVFINSIDGVLQTILENPRGKTPLRWITRYPEADAIHAHGLLEGSTVIPASPRALRDAFNLNYRDYQKSVTIRRILTHIMGESLVCTEDEQYQEQRRMIQPLFKLNFTREAHACAWEKAGILVYKLAHVSSEDGAYLDLFPYVFRYVIDVTSASIHSYDFDALRTRWNDKDTILLRRILSPRTSSTLHQALGVLLPPWLVFALPLHQNRSMIQRGKELRIVAETMVDSAKRDQELGKGSDSCPLRQMIATQACNDKEMIEHALTFLLAGIETTTAAILWAFHALTLPENAHFQAPLREELLSALDGDDPSPSHSKMSSLPLLHGLIEESLRLFPPIPFTTRQTVKPSTMAGQPIPANTNVAFQLYAINRNPQFWGPKAHIFDPYRWIDVGEDGEMKINKHGGAGSNYCFATFLHGPRTCLGKELSKVALRCAIAGILRRFRVERWEGDEGKLEIGGTVVVRPTAGLSLRFRPIE